MANSQGGVLVALYQEQKGLCYYCDYELEPLIHRKRSCHVSGCMLLTHTSSVDGEIDHITPRSQGGGRNDNLCLACRWCNRLKADRDKEQFIQMLRERIYKHLIDVSGLIYDYDRLLNTVGGDEFCEDIKLFREHNGLVPVSENLAVSNV